MKPYRFKHKPSGLYYCNSRKIRDPYGPLYSYMKSNLSENGKVYFKSYKLENLIGSNFYSHLLPYIEGQTWDRSRSEKYNPDDWEKEAITDLE